jgi:hypothetical protein
MALRDKIAIKKTITVNLTPGDWQLYTMPGDMLAARQLNQALEQLVNSGNDSTATRNSMLLVMEKLSQFGAADSEPIYTLEDVLDAIYD